MDSPVEGDGFELSRFPLGWASASGPNPFIFLPVPALGNHPFASGGPRVRIQFPRAVSQVRTAIGPPEFPVAPRKQAQAPSSTGDRGFESTSLQRRVGRTSDLSGSPAQKGMYRRPD
jgi:hypothetical protein